MIRSYSAFAALLFSISCGAQQIPTHEATPATCVAAAGANDANPAAIAAADDAWRAGILASNLETLERVVGAEFTLTTAFGVVPRPAWMANSKAWQTKALEWRYAPHVDVYSDAAVVRGTLHWNVIKDKPDPRTGSAEVDLDFLVTDVWVRRTGQWQVVSRHSTLPLSH